MATDTPAQLYQKLVAEMNVLLAKVEVLEAKGSIPKDSPKKPPEFEGGRYDSIHTWLWHAKIYLEDALPGRQELWLRRIAGFLRKNAATWFQYRAKDLANKGISDTYELFERDILIAYTPIDVTLRARDRLAILEQNDRHVDVYNHAFITTAMQIPGITEDEKLDRFKRGLRGDIMKEVHMKNPKTLEDAMLIACSHDALSKRANSMKRYHNRSSGNYYGNYGYDNYGPSKLRQ
jgi:hypothetical protein